MATEAEKKPEGEAAPAESPAPVIIIKKVMDDGHGGAHGGQPVVQSLRVVFHGDLQGIAQQHRSGIEAGIHLHDADAGLVVSRQQRALNRRGTAPTRQQRGVDVEAAPARRGGRVLPTHGIEHPLRQQQAVGRHHHGIGLGGFDRRTSG